MYLAIQYILRFLLVCISQHVALTACPFYTIFTHTNWIEKSVSGVQLTNTVTKTQRSPDIHSTNRNILVREILTDNLHQAGKQKALLIDHTLSPTKLILAANPHTRLHFLTCLAFNSIGHTVSCWSQLWVYYLVKDIFQDGHAPLREQGYHQRPLVDRMESPKDHKRWVIFGGRYGAKKHAGKGKIEGDSDWIDNLQNACSFQVQTREASRRWDFWDRISGAR